MKLRKLIREELNLTQDEMATLLNITRSQLSLYELGLRELSTMGLVRHSRAGIFLGMLKISESNPVQKIIELESEKDKFIAYALKKNQFDQLFCEEKIEKMERNYKAALKLFQLTDYTIQSEDYKDALHRSGLESLKAKAGKKLDKNGPQQLVKLQLRQQLLKQEVLLLKALDNKTINTLK